MALEFPLLSALPQQSEHGSSLEQVVLAPAQHEVAVEQEQLPESLGQELALVVSVQLGPIEPVLASQKRVQLEPIEQVQAPAQEY